MKLQFVTTESLNSYSGGWSGNSYNIYNHLAEEDQLDLHYIGPLRPAPSTAGKYISRMLRMLGMKSKFYYFSDTRLTKIRRMIEERVADEIPDYTFFMGSTHWLKYTPSNPYGAYLDASFRTYFDNNIKTSSFSKRDIKRIESLEKSWLENASHVFWASEWARDEAIRQYGLQVDNHYVVGIGGNLALPETTSYKGGYSFLLMAQNFYLKGGDLAFDAFRRIYEVHKDARFIVLGQQPPEYVLKHPGVLYPGYLKKDNPEENANFREILGEAFCLLHPTKSDAIPQVIIECAYFGCPAIAPARFAIPELISDRRTGCLLGKDFEVKDLKKEMLYLIENREAYLKMRDECRKYHLSEYTYSKVTGRILNIISASLE